MIKREIGEILVLYVAYRFLSLSWMHDFVNIFFCTSFGTGVLQFYIEPNGILSIIYVSPY